MLVADRQVREPQTLELGGDVGDQPVDVSAGLQPLTEAGWGEMQKWREANRREERPLHRYTLEEFGLTEDRIKDLFAAYRERFITPQIAPQP